MFEKMKHKIFDCRAMYESINDIAISETEMEEHIRNEQTTFILHFFLDIFF